MLVESDVESQLYEELDMTTMTSQEPSPVAAHRTVERVMSILELVLDKEPEGMRLHDLSLAIDAPKSSVHGLAKGLIAAGYFREERGRYFAGPAVSTLIAGRSMALPSYYRRALKELTGKWNETSMLAMLVGDSMLYVDAVESDSFIRAAPTLNKRMSLWPRSAGKCFLAYMDAKRLEAYLRRNPLGGPKDMDKIRRELATVRDTRIGLNVGQSTVGHIGLACPIVVGDGPVSMAVAMGGPSARMEPNLDAMSLDLRETAASLGHSI